MNTQLTYNVCPLYITHLGRNMYVNVADALAQLVANSHDADATECVICLNRDKNEIEVIDDGHGMSVQSLQETLFNNNHQKRATNERSPQGRPYMGRKNTGFHAVWALGDTVAITTKKDKEATVSCVLESERILDTKTSPAETLRHPVTATVRQDEMPSHTRITLRNLRVVIPDTDTLREEISRQFQFSVNFPFQLFVIDTQ